MTEIVARVSPSCVKTAESSDSSSADKLSDKAEARILIKIGISQQIKIYHHYTVYLAIRKSVISFIDVDI